MNSLNTYMSDAESDDSEKHYENATSMKEVDANCEPITMDMSEESDRSYNGSARWHSKKSRNRSRSFSSSDSYSSVDSSDEGNVEFSKKKKYDENSYSSDDSPERIKDKNIGKDQEKQGNKRKGKETEDGKNEKIYQRKDSLDDSRSSENDDRKSRDKKYDDDRRKEIRTGRHERDNEQENSHRDYHERDRGKEREFDHQRERASERERTSERERDHQRERGNKRESDHESERSSERERDRDRERGRDYEQRERGSERDRSRERKCDRNKDNGRDRDRDKDHDRGKNQDRDHDNEHERKRDRDRNRERDHNSERVRERDRDSERVHDRHRDHRSGRSDRKHSRQSKSRSSSYHRSRRSRTRSRTPRRKNSRSRYDDKKSSYKIKSPYRSGRGNHGSSYARYDRRSKNKLQVLEKLGIELKVPPSTEPLTITKNTPTTINSALAAAKAAAAAASAAVNTVIANTVILPVVNNPSRLPLSTDIAARVANPTQLTPQILLQKQMEEQVEKVKSATGIELPSYYNPIAVNPTKYAEQIQKRRLLWGNKDKPKPIETTSPNTDTTELGENKGSTTIWKGASFGDQDGKTTAKFKRLMGIKGAEQEKQPPTEATGSDLIKKQEEMFNSMESQYEVARLATHSHRGLGLGFGTFQPR